MIRHLLVLLTVLGIALPETSLCGEGTDSPASDSAASEVSEPETASAEDTGALRFAFRDAAWPHVLEWFAERAGLTLDLTDTPEGTFNYVEWSKN